MSGIGYEYSPIVSRDVLKWPRDARLALWVAVGIEHFEFGLPVPGGVGSAVGHAPDVRNYSVRDYGNRVGIWRLIEVLDKYNIRATALVNSAACDHYPFVIEEVKKRGWELAAHGVTNSHVLTMLSEEEERRTIKQAIRAITDAAGKRPEGWCSPGLAETWNTRHILIEEGVRYVCDWCNDDQPYLMKVRNGTLVAIPYSVDINDLPAFSYYHLTPSEFYEMVANQFDVLYEEGIASGRVMSITLHPFIIGVPFRIRVLERILNHLAQRKDVWFATAGEIVSWYYKSYVRNSNDPGNKI